jgi:hypothetical protein
MVALEPQLGPIGAFAAETGSTNPGAIRWAADG